MIDTARAFRHSDSLLASFSTYHANVDETREFSRRREAHGKVKDNHQLITVKTARAQNLLMQMLSYITSDIKASVIADSNTSKEDAITGKIERFLSGVPDTLRYRVGDYIQDGNAHLIESGLIAYYLQFNPELACMGEFPYDLIVVDPRTFAYSRSLRGLEAATILEERTAGALLAEVEALIEKAGRKKSKVNAPDNLRRTADNDPELVVELRRYWDKENEVWWCNGAQILSRPHLMTRVPFAIGAWGIPSTLPEEIHQGFLFPVLESLENLDRYLNLLINTARYQLNPMALSYDAQLNETTFGQIVPGIKMQGQAQPVPFNADPRLFEMAARTMSNDVDEATAPKIITSGSGEASGATSGYMASQLQGGFKAKMDMLLKVPERVHAELYSLLLTTMEEFSDSAKAKVFGGDKADEYMSSFSTTVPIDAKAKRKQYSKVTLSAEDIAGHTRVIVSLQPNLPSDENAKLQRVQMALAAGLDYETVIRDIYQAEKPEEILERRKIEELKAKVQPFAEMMAQAELKAYLLDHPEAKKQWIEYWAAQGVEIDPKTLEPLNQPEPQDAQGMEQEQAAPIGPAPSPLMDEGQMPMGQGMPQGMPPELMAMMQQSGMGGAGVPSAEAGNAPVLPSELMGMPPGASPMMQ